MRRERRFHLLIERENIRQYEILGPRIDLPQVRAHQHRRQPALELHGRTEQHHGNAEPVEPRNCLLDVGDHALESRRTGVFQPVRGEYDEVGLATPEECIHLLGKAAA